MKIYVASPYSIGDIDSNVELAIHYGDCVARKGHIPFIPVLNHFWHTIYPKPWTWWLAYDMEWLKVCDAVLRVPGESFGADKEVEWATQNEIPVYRSIKEIPDADMERP